MNFQVHFLGASARNCDIFAQWFRHTLKNTDPYLLNTPMTSDVICQVYGDASVQGYENPDADATQMLVVPYVFAITLKEEHDTIRNIEIHYFYMKEGMLHCDTQMWDPIEIDEPTTHEEET